MRLTNRQWYATYLVAAFVGIVIGMALPNAVAASSQRGHIWITRIYSVEQQHIVLIAVTMLIALATFALKKKPIGPAGWPVYFGIVVV